MDQCPNAPRMLRIVLQSFDLALRDIHGLAQFQQCLAVAGDGCPDVVERVFHAVAPRVDALDVGDVHTVHAGCALKNDDGDIHGRSL